MELQVLVSAGPPLQPSCTLTPLSIPWPRITTVLQVSGSLAKLCAKAACSWQLTCLGVCHLARIGHVTQQPQRLTQARYGTCGVVQMIPTNQAHALTATTWPRRGMEDQCFLCITPLLPISHSKLHLHPRLQLQLRLRLSAAAAAGFCGSMATTSRVAVQLLPPSRVAFPLRPKPADGCPIPLEF